MQGRITRRRAVMAGAAAGVLTATRSSAATTWQAYTYNPVGTVAAVVGFKRLISGFENSANGSYTVSMHLGGSLPIADSITAAVSDNVVQFGDDGFATGTSRSPPCCACPCCCKASTTWRRRWRSCSRIWIALTAARHRGARPVHVSVPGDLGPQEITSLADIKG